MQQLDAFKSVARKEATAGAVKQEKKTLILSTGPLAVQEMQRGITIGAYSSVGAQHLGFICDEIGYHI